MMAIKEFYEQLDGNWIGNYSLWLDPSKPAIESGVSATVVPVAMSAFYLFHYWWSYGGNDQEGVFMLGGEDHAATATWGDSFHMQPESMYCKGQFEGAKLALLGRYSAGPGTPDWGWRTEFTLNDGHWLRMEAYNISPGGHENLAVRADLKRDGE